MVTTVPLPVTKKCDSMWYDMSGLFDVADVMWSLQEAHHQGRFEHFGSGMKKACRFQRWASRKRNGKILVSTYNVVITNMYM